MEKQNSGQDFKKKGNEKTRKRIEPTQNCLVVKFLLLQKIQMFQVLTYGRLKIVLKGVQQWLAESGRVKGEMKSGWFFVFSISVGRKPKMEH